jgi:hypothetical protein
MANVTGSFLQGILVPDPRITVDSMDAALTSATETGPRAGVPVDQGASSLTLSAWGEQVAATSLDVGVLRPGAPPLIKWRETGDTYWRGWQPPNVLTGREFILYTSATIVGSARPHVITLASGVVLAIEEYVAAGATVTAVLALDADDDAPTWSGRTTVYTHPQVSTYGAHGSLVQLASGRVLAYYWVEDLDAASAVSKARVQMSYSDDDGATWTLGASSVLGVPESVATATFQPGRIRVARSGSQMLMVIGFRATDRNFNDVLRQYASIDQGATWEEIVEFSGDADSNHHDGRFQDLVGLANGGGFVLAYIRMPLLAASTRYDLMVRRLGAASQPMTAGSADLVLIDDVSSTYVSWALGTIDGTPDPDYPGGTIDTGDLAMCVDEDGAIYIYGRNAANAQTGVVVRSVDRGASWLPFCEGVGREGYVAWHLGDSAAYPTGFSATMQHGRAVMVTQHAANPGAGDQSLSALYLGGYTSMPCGAIDGGVGGDALNRCGWSVVWQPFDLPENTGSYWTRTLTGAPTAPSFDANGDLSMSTAGAQTIYYTHTASAVGVAPATVIVEAEVQVTSGTAEIYASRDGTTDWQVRVAVSTTSIVFRDVVAGSNIATVTTTDGATGVRVRIYLANGKAAAFYRLVDASHDQSWTLIGASSSLTAGGSAGDQIKVGIPASSAAVWRYFAMLETDWNATASWTSVADLEAMALGRSPGCYLDQGVSVGATGGHALLGDEWVIATAYDYPVEAVDPNYAPSPSREWRSTQTANAEIIAWSWHAAGTVSYPPGTALGLYLGGANFRTAYFEALNVGGTWDTLGTWDGADGQSALRFTRTGESITVDGSGSSTSPWYPVDALAGSTFQMSSSVARRILTNSAGTWSASTLQTPILRLEAVAGGDPGSGTTGKILAKNGLLIIPSVGGAAFRAFRVRVPGGQPTPDGDYRIGVAMLGIVHVWGQEYSWGRRVDLSPNEVISTARSGARTSRRMGAPRRAVDIAWPDGVDTTQIGGASPTPDYVVARTGGNPAATPAGTPWDVLGVVQRAGRSPVVYFDGMPISSATERLIVHPSRTIYGRIVSDVSIEQVVGREWGDTAGEVMRVATVRIEEEV